MDMVISRLVQPVSEWGEFKMESSRLSIEPDLQIEETHHHIYITAINCSQFVEVEDAYRHIDIYYGCSCPEKVRGDLANYMVRCSGRQASHDLTVLDMGCGTGCLTIPLAGLAHTAFGVDLDPYAVELTCSRKVLHGVENLQIIQGNWINLNHLVGQNSTDVAVCWGNSLGYVISWLQPKVNPIEATEAVRETLHGVFMTLRTGGTFVLQIEKEENLRSVATTREMVIPEADRIHVLRWKIEYHPDGARVNHARRKTITRGKPARDEDSVEYSIDFVGVRVKPSCVVRDMYAMGFRQVRILPDQSNPFCVVVVGEK
jgi:precorrin-6B methylase 2